MFRRFGWRQEGGDSLLSPGGVLCRADIILMLGVRKLARALIRTDASDDARPQDENFSSALDRAAASGEFDDFQTPPSTSASDDEGQGQGLGRGEDGDDVYTRAESIHGRAYGTSRQRDDHQNVHDTVGADIESPSRRRRHHQRTGSGTSVGAMDGKFVLDGIANLSRSIMSSTTESCRSLSYALISPRNTLASFSHSATVSSPGGHGSPAPNSLLSKYNLELKSPRKTVMKTNLYEPPDLDKALAHMEGFRPHMHSETWSARRVHAGLSVAESITEKLLRFPPHLFSIAHQMQGVFSVGVCFWFIILRDYFFVFVAFTLVSIPFFRLAAVSNYRAETSGERLNSLSRASLGAMLLWGDAKAKTDAVTDVDKNNALSIVCLDAINMLALLAVTVYHYFKKIRVTRRVDMNTFTIDDYTVQIHSGLPEDATEERVRAHFERVLLCAKDSDVRDEPPRQMEMEEAVYEVTFGRDVGPVMKLRRRLLALEAKHDWLEWLVLRAKKILGEEDIKADEEGGRRGGGGVANAVNLLSKKNRTNNKTKFGTTLVQTAMDGEQQENNGDAEDGYSSAKEEVEEDAPGGHGSRKKNGNGGVSPARERWNKAVRQFQLENKNRSVMTMWSLALAGARDTTRSMKERAEEAAKAAKRSDKLGLTRCGTFDNTNSDKPAGKAVGAAVSYRAEDYNLDILREKLRLNLLAREETADTIAAFAQKGYPIVNAWVTFSEEKHKIKVLGALKDDACLFEGKHRIVVKEAKDPSDVLWENLSYPKKTMWKRQLRSMFMTLMLILITAAAVSAAKTQIRLLPPKVLCEDLGAGGVYLDCPAIWDLEASSGSGGVAGQLHPARQNILPFIEQDATAHTCKSFMKKGKFVGDMSGYKGVYSTANVTSSSLPSNVGGVWNGGFDSASEVDECAAHACYGCYCKKRGYFNYRNDVDGLGSFCDEFWSNEVLAQVFWIGGVMVSSGMNIVIKLASIMLSKMERPHSITFQEVSISWKMMLALVINTALVPLMIGADIPQMRLLPFLFKGDYPGVTSEWYAEVGNGLVQVAFINAFAFPLSCLGKVWRWQIRNWFLTPRVKTQRQLNQLYRPPKFLLSERYGPFLAAIVYSVMFSSGMPVLYVVLVVWCAVQIAVDRLTLFRYCATPSRYTGKLAALLLHVVPVTVLLHFAIATYIFGERSLPSWLLKGGVGAKYTTPGSTTEEVVDAQWDVYARLTRVNGLIPAVGLISSGALMAVSYSVLAAKYSRRMMKGGVSSDSLSAEGCPPVIEAIARGELTGLTSYSITVNPDYKHLFPPGDEVSEGL